MTNSAPSLADRAMLVRLSVSTWSAVKSQKDVDREVADNHNSDVRMGNFYKKLLAPKAQAGINRAWSVLYNEHMKRTLPWMDGRGERIMASSGYFDYVNAVTNAINDFNSEVEKFVDLIDDHIEDSKKRLGSLWDESDYPTKEDVKKKYSARYEIFPVPAAHDFRIDLGEAEVQRVQNEIELRVNNAARESIYDAAKRIKEVVENFRDHAYGGLRESTVKNIYELASLIPSLNITGDPRLDEIADDMKGIGVMSASAIRQGYGRTAAVDKADEILKKVGAFAI